MLIGHPANMCPSQVYHLPGLVVYKWLNHSNLITQLFKNLFALSPVSRIKFRLLGLLCWRLSNAIPAHLSNLFPLLLSFMYLIMWLDFSLAPVRLHIWIPSLYWWYFLCLKYTTCSFILRQDFPQRAPSSWSLPWLGQTLSAALYDSEASYSCH